MTLYQEIPKDTLISELRSRYNPEEFAIIYPHLYPLLDSCHTLDELYQKLYEILATKKMQEEYKVINQDNFIGI